MPRIALNFFPLQSDEFDVQCFRLPYVEAERPSCGQETAVRRLLKVDGTEALYWTLFQSVEDGVEFTCTPYEYAYLTIDALRLALIQSCEKNLDENSFRLVGGIRKTVEIVTDVYEEGSRVVLLEPYLLRSRDTFGFLADSRFHPLAEHRRTRRTLQLSFALDKHEKSNKDYYADRFSSLREFVSKYFGQIFPLILPGGAKIRVKSRLVELSPERLDVKSYLVGSGTESNSQFMGIKRSGPLAEVPARAHLHFLYRQQDHALSQDLFRALRGDTFSTFPGMEKMFNLPISQKNVRGTALSSFDSTEINQVSEQIVNDANGQQVVPILLTPFSRHDAPEENETYWILKHVFLSRRLPIQVVATETVADKNKLKWSVAGIGLQTFAKLGGTPWKVRPRTEKCLIVGIGQAHRKTEQRIEKFFAYSVLTDSSGAFEEIRVLGEDSDEQSYINSFRSSLGKIFEDYSSRFSNFVIHSTFSIRRHELDVIASVLAERKEASDGGEFVSMKFNDRNRFFGFAVDHNSLVPHESTLVRLSRNEFVVWFEGLQYGQATLRNKVGNPLHVKFTYPHKGLTDELRRSHLQDAINLSGANWRGFNAKSLPVSVYYAQLIAKYLKEFEHHRLPSVDVDIIAPWFL